MSNLFCNGKFFISYSSANFILNVNFINHIVVKGSISEQIEYSKDSISPSNLRKRLSFYDISLRRQTTTSVCQ